MKQNKKGKIYFVIYIAGFFFKFFFCFEVFAKQKKKKESRNNYWRQFLAIFEFLLLGSRISLAGVAGSYWFLETSLGGWVAEFVSSMCAWKHAGWVCCYHV